MTHAKTLVAVLTAVAVALSTFVATDSTMGKSITVLLALLGALGVYAVPNRPAPPR